MTWAPVPQRRGEEALATWREPHQSTVAGLCPGRATFATLWSLAPFSWIFFFICVISFFFLYHGYLSYILILSKLLYIRLLTFWSTNWISLSSISLAACSRSPELSLPTPRVLPIRVTNPLCSAFHFSLQVKLSTSILPKTFVLFLYFLEEISPPILFSALQISHHFLS